MTILTKTNCAVKTKTLSNELFDRLRFSEPFPGMILDAFARVKTVNKWEAQINIYRRLGQLDRPEGPHFDVVISTEQTRSSSAVSLPAWQHLIRAHWFTTGHCDHERSGEPHPHCERYVGQSASPFPRGSHVPCLSEALINRTNRTNASCNTRSCKCVSLVARLPNG